MGSCVCHRKCVVEVYVNLYHVDKNLCHVDENLCHVDENELFLQRVYEYEVASK